MKSSDLDALLQNVRQAVPFQRDPGSEGEIRSWDWASSLFVDNSPRAVANRVRAELRRHSEARAASLGLEGFVSTINPESSLPKEYAACLLGYAIVGALIGGALAIGSKVRAAQKRGVVDKGWWRPWKPEDPL